MIVCLVPLKGFKPQVSGPAPLSGTVALRPPLFSLQLKELYGLLNENYVEDDDNMFRFDYSPDFLLW